MAIGIGSPTRSPIAEEGGQREDPYSHLSPIAHRTSPLRTKAAQRAGLLRVVPALGGATCPPSGSFSGFSSIPRCLASSARRLDQPGVVEDGQLGLTQRLQLGEFLGPEVGVELLHEHGGGGVVDPPQAGDDRAPAAWKARWRPCTPWP